MIAGSGRADAGVYLSRLMRLDPGAMVRLRPGSVDGVELWAMLPFGVLATRTVAGTAVDHVYPADELLSWLAAPARGSGKAEPARRDDPAPGELKPRDEAWHWPLPGTRATVVERLPAAEVARVAAAAARTLREAAAGGVGGRPVGERVLRDTLLDHVPIVVEVPDQHPIEVPQRLVQGLVRMGFLGPVATTSSEATVTVRVAGSWIGLSGAYGSAWYRPPLSLKLI